MTHKEKRTIMKECISVEQEAQIYCIKNGHADYISMCFGYVHCGRCNEQIGDTLAGIYDTTNKMLIGHKCKKCSEVKSKLNKLDKKIVNRLEKADSFPDYGKILKGIDFS